MEIANHVKLVSLVIVAIIVIGLSEQKVIVWWTRSSTIKPKKCINVETNKLN